MEVRLGFDASRNLLLASTQVTSQACEHRFGPSSCLLVISSCPWFDLPPPVLHCFPSHRQHSDIDFWCAARLGKYVRTSGRKAKWAILGAQLRIIASTVKSANSVHFPSLYCSFLSFVYLGLAIRLWSMRIHRWLPRDTTDYALRISNRMEMTHCILLRRSRKVVIRSVDALTNLTITVYLMWRSSIWWCETGTVQRLSAFPTHCDASCSLNQSCRPVGPTSVKMRMRTQCEWTFFFLARLSASQLDGLISW